MFKLENGFNGMTGALSQGGAQFGRQAWVGIATRYGTLTLGRQYDALVDYLSQGSGGIAWGTIYSVHPGDYDNIANSYRANSSIKYRIETDGGLSFSALASLGGVAGEFRRNSLYSFGAGYRFGGAQLGLAYTTIRDPNFSFYGNNPSSSTTASNMGSSTVFSGYASAGSERLLGISATYAFGASKLGMIVTHTRFGELGTETGIANAFGRGASAFLDNLDLNYRYRFTPNLTAGVAYDLSAGHAMNGHDGARYHQFNLGVDYALSRRTDLYVAGVYQHASGYDSRNRPAVANIVGTSASSTPNQLVTVAGMRHRF